MSLVVIAAPSPFVSLEEAKAHLRVDGNDEDDLIAVLCAAACGLIDGPGGWLEHAVGTQTLELRLAAFPASAICLPCPPVVSIASVKYTDVDGDEQTVAGAVYRLTGIGTSKARLELESGQSWPAAKSESESVRVRYAAGYANPPGALRAAALLMISDLYHNRETVVVGASVAEIRMPATVESLVGPYRQVRV